MSPLSNVRFPVESYASNVSIYLGLDGKDTFVQMMNKYNCYFNDLMTKSFDENSQIINYKNQMNELRLLFERCQNAVIDFKGIARDNFHNLNNAPTLRQLQTVSRSPNTDSNANYASTVLETLYTQLMPLFCNLKGMQSLQLILPETSRNNNDALKLMIEVCNHFGQESKDSKAIVSHLALYSTDFRSGDERVRSNVWKRSDSDNVLHQFIEKMLKKHECKGLDICDLNELQWRVLTQIHETLLQTSLTAIAIPKDFDIHIIDSELSLNTREIWDNCRQQWMQSKLSMPSISTNWEETAFNQVQTSIDTIINTRGNLRKDLTLILNGFETNWLFRIGELPQFSLLNAQCTPYQIKMAGSVFGNLCGNLSNLVVVQTLDFDFIESVTIRSIPLHPLSRSVNDESDSSASSITERSSSADSKGSEESQGKRSMGKLDIKDECNRSKIKGIVKTTADKFLCKQSEYGPLFPNLKKLQFKFHLLKNENIEYNIDIVEPMIWTFLESVYHMFVEQVLQANNGFSYVESVNIILEYGYSSTEVRTKQSLDEMKQCSRLESVQPRIEYLQQLHQNFLEMVRARSPCKYCVTFARVALV